MAIDAPKLSSTLSALFPSKAMARLVIFFLAHPGERFHVRELQRRTRLSSASLQKELKRMEAIGAFQREMEKGRAYYRANEEVGPWGGWMRLLRNAANPADVVREALVAAPGLDAAFIFGSVARGDAREDSDIDLFLVGPAEARRAAVGLLSALGYFIPRPLDVIGRDRAQITAEPPSGFVRRVLAEPKHWLLGGPADLALEAAA
jgi:predicted nucleotidyltransferase